ncbi:MAG: universal stress protein [Anaerolineae bacterium]
MRILLCTQCASHAANTLEMGRRVVRQVGGEMDILLVDGERRAEICKIAENTAAEIRNGGVPVRIQEQQGGVERTVLHEVHLHSYDLVIIGSRGRKGLIKMLFGSVALQVTGQTPLPVLVVKGRLRKLRKFLVCTSAGPASERTVAFATDLAQALGAKIHLLHVMSQLSLSGRGHTLEELEASAEDLMDGGAREGDHLKEMLKLVQRAGVEARALVRHGLVVDEVIAETKKGRYDLIALGAHVTPGVPPSMVNDLAGRILLAADRPVLVVH